MFVDEIHIDRSTNTDILTCVRGWLRQAYASPDAYHGVEHAEDVLRLAAGIARRVRGGLKPVEQLVLAVAALLHDVGYTAYQPSWVPNRREHVPASIAFAQRHLEEIPLFAQHTRLISAVALLIAYHDDTSYKFPSKVWNGRVGSIDLGQYAAALSAFEESAPLAQRKRLRLLLAILREADALTAAGSTGAERTFQYAIHRGLPVFARGNPLNAWCWEESAAGNTRLAAKRALIDAFTPEGRRVAWESYRASEAYLQGICAEHGVPYEPEIITTAGSHDPPSIGAVGSAESALELISYAGWESLQQTLRNAALAEASEVRPYATANMAVRQLPLDLLPNESQTGDHEASRVATRASLHAHLLSEYALSLFDLTGIIEYQLGGIVMRAAPPIIERHPAAASAADELTVADGAATVALAQELGVVKLWVVEVEATLGIGSGSRLVWEHAERSGVESVISSQDQA